jgi:RNA polymerase sigma factor (TIGR02999 family)
VNETFLRLLDAQGVAWQDRGHFLGIAARLMRRVLVDHARTRGGQKRGGGHQPISLDDAMAVASPLDFNLLALDYALDALADVDERKARVIEMRFFGGMTVDETAKALNVSADTVKRDWRVAKLWLLKYLDADPRE